MVHLMVSDASTIAFAAFSCRELRGYQIRGIILLKNLEKEVLICIAVTCANSSCRFFILSSLFFLFESWPSIFLIASAYNFMCKLVLSM